MNLFSVAARSWGLERILLFVIIIAVLSIFGYAVFNTLTNCFATVTNAL